jgi:hypothetical protein
MSGKDNRISLAVPKATLAAYRGMAEARGVSLNAIICATLFDALPEQVTTKPLSAREQGAAKQAARKATVQAMFRRELAEGKTPEQILAPCQTWRAEASAWLAEVIHDRGLTAGALDDVHDIDEDNEGD